MKRPAHIYNCITALMALCLVLPSAERIKTRKLRSRTITQAPAQPGYLNDGEPFALRKAPQLRPPAYAPARFAHRPRSAAAPSDEQPPCATVEPSPNGGSCPGRRGHYSSHAYCPDPTVSHRGEAHVYRANNSWPTSLEGPCRRARDN